MSRVPLLFIHYFQHLQEDKDMSIAEFLDIHYMHGVVVDDDYEQDKQLPFKNAQDFGSTSVFIFQNLHEIHLNYKIPGASIEKSVIRHKADFIEKPAASLIFHPPRLV